MQDQGNASNDNPEQPKGSGKSHQGEPQHTKSDGHIIGRRTKLEIAVIDTTITIAADMMPASTAACPMTSVPTIETAAPMYFGIRTPASRNISKVNSIMSASIKAGRERPPAVLPDRSAVRSAAFPDET